MRCGSRDVNSPDRTYQRPARHDHRLRLAQSRAQFMAGGLFYAACSGPLHFIAGFPAQREGLCGNAAISAAWGMQKSMTDDELVAAIDKYLTHEYLVKSRRARFPRCWQQRGNKYKEPFRSGSQSDPQDGRTWNDNAALKSCVTVTRDAPGVVRRNAETS
jgi:hypothetical protein